MGSNPGFPISSLCLISKIRKIALLQNYGPGNDVCGSITSHSKAPLLGRPSTPASSV